MRVHLALGAAFLCATTLVALEKDAPAKDSPKSGPQRGASMGTFTVVDVTGPAKGGAPLCYI